MADIIDFTARRLEKNGPPKAVSLQEVAFDSVDFLLGEWEKHVRKNSLNKYFITSLPSFIDQDTRVNFMKDLTLLSEIEIKLGLSIAVFFPGTIEASQIGWIVRFKVEDQEVFTPDMGSECYARAFAILLYLKVKGTARDLGLLD